MEGSTLAVDGVASNPSAAILTAPVSDASAWRAADFIADRSWIVVLTEAAVAEGMQPAQGSVRGIVTERPSLFGRPLRVRWKFSVARAVGVPIGLSGGREADCPSTPFISKHLAVFFHALQCRFGSLGKVRDRFGDLGRRHHLTGKRQFTQDHFAYRPAPPPPR